MMMFKKRILLIGAMAASFVLPAVSSARPENADAHAVFVMTNDADANEVVAFDRAEDGTLSNPQRYKTDGRGSGGTVDPLSSQGSLTLSEDRSWLFAANAGSGTLSVFRVSGSRLDLSDRVPTDGSEPNAVAQHGNLVYVLNTAGSSSVVGFRFQEGKLTRIPDSLRLLSENGAGSGSVAFSPNGQFLAVTERTSNSIDVFSVLGDGTLSPIKVNPSAGPGAFAVSFAPDGIALVSETGSAAPNSAAISSYTVEADGTLVPISVSVPTLGAANCWNAATGNGRFVYVSNAGSSSIAGFAVSSGGTLTAIPGTIVALNPKGSSNIDIAVSADDKFLFSLNAASGRVGAFAIDPVHGTVTSLGSFGDLPASAGLNGIAAN
ncbi:MAG TPA: beta-propeller fold lactonase family protein [Steroidobacteraceae bacterium]